MVDERYRSHEFLPITNFHEVNCLVLKKYDKDIRFAKNHDYVVLVPDTSIQEGKEINSIKEGETAIMQMFTYEIHNNFKDLRGKKRLDQLHLACLIAATEIQNF